MDIFRDALASFKKNFLSGLEPVALEIGGGAHGAKIGGAYHGLYDYLGRPKHAQLRPGWLSISKISLGDSRTDLGFLRDFRADTHSSLDLEAMRVPGSLDGFLEPHCAGGAPKL